MTDDSTINPTSTGEYDISTDRQVKSIQGVEQDSRELKPLERQRLDTAVMMLVNYLVSASSSKN